MAEESAVHRWWRCPSLDLARHQAQVGDLALQVARCDFQPRCLWQNGLLPAGEVELKPSGPMRREDSVPREPLLGAIDGVYEAWTDGSALHPTVRQLCRAGWGLWMNTCG